MSVFPEEDSMLRRVAMTLCLCAFGLALAGCGSGNNQAANNPSNLEYSNEGPPKRDGVQGGKKK